MRFGKTKQWDEPGQHAISEAVRKATNKYLTRPDAGLNAKVVSTINSSQESDVDGQTIASIIVRRMGHPNPHKQWLTIVVAQRVLRDCKQRVEEGKTELLQEIARVASRPIGTAVVQSSGAQKAKQEGYAVLQEHGQAGIEAMRVVGGDAAANLLVNEQAAHTGNRSTANSAAAAALRTARWEDTKEAVERDVAMAKSQTEILNDMVSNFKKGNSNSDKVFFEDLATQMVQLRLSFESTMSALGQFSTPEANHLTITALEAVDSMNKALEGYHQVSHLIGS